MEPLVQIFNQYKAKQPMFVDDHMPARIVNVQVLDSMTIYPGRIVIEHNVSGNDCVSASFKLDDKNQVQSIIRALQKML